MNQTEIYHEVLINLLRPSPDYANPEKVYEESTKIVLNIEAVVAKLNTELPNGWWLEVEE